MRRALLGMTFVLAGCTAKPTEQPITPVPSASAAAVPVKDAAPPGEPEKPLTWGTRPNVKGPFYPVVDGMCVHGEIWPAGDRALFTFGNSTGPYSRGAHATIARLDDDGLVVVPTLETAIDLPNETKNREELGAVSPMSIHGAWPSIFLYSYDQGRLRSYESLWRFGSDGWTNLESARAEPGEKDDVTAGPLIASPAVFKGWLVVARASSDVGGENAGRWKNQTIKSWPIEKGAPPIPGLSQLVRARFVPGRLEATSDSIYAFPELQSQDEHTVRILTDGKVVETSISEYPSGVGTKFHHHDNALIEVGSSSVHRWDGPKRTKLPFKLGPGVTITGSAVAPSGDVWIETSKSGVMVLHDGAVTETPLPTPASPKPKEAIEHWPRTGGMLAGVEHDDPWAIGATGSLFHLEAGKWTEVELPAPPFATKGQYQAQALVMKAKGDLLVNAGYAEKGLGWKTAERYRAVLRQKRPREVLRCNEPVGEASRGAGAGFSSSPPIADDTCTTPFVALLRLATDHVYGRAQGYPALRKVLAETPSLGPSVDLVEFKWNGTTFLGVRSPTVAAGRELAELVGKKVKADFYETRPEVLCGAPAKIEKTIHVDVAGPAR